MKTLRVNEYDMAYLDIGKGSPIVCIHGSLNDFRAWNGVLGPLSANNRLIAPSMRHYFPEHWNGEGGQFRMDQHIDDAIAFIEDLGLGPVDLIGHSRGGHISFRVGLERPDLISKLVLAEPGGTLEDDLMPEETSNLSEGAGSRAHVTRSSERIAAGDLEGGLRAFIDGINGPGSWEKLPLADRQMREDNAYTLLAQINEGRRPYSKADAEALSPPTLFVGGADTTGLLPIVLRALAAHAPNAETAIIPNAGHSMFRQQPRAFCDVVLPFLKR